MKERPLLFSAPMVRAILEGRKTVTRRVVKGMALEWLDADRFTPEYVAMPENGMCPYGQPGDRLWVRETFALENTSEYAGDSSVTIPPPLGPVRENYWEEGGQLIPRYRASEPDTQLMIAPSDADEIGMRWTPSIHMPRWASRITLEVTGVRVERLQDISEGDATAEGAEAAAPMDKRYRFTRPHVAGFCNLWQSINGLDSWDANPWVWVVEFKRMEAAP